MQSIESPLTCGGTLIHKRVDDLVINSVVGTWFLGTGAAMASAGLVAWAVARVWFHEKARFVRSLRQLVITTDGEE
jgi:hypothetical protein